MFPLSGLMIDYPFIIMAWIICQAHYVLNYIFYLNILLPKNSGNWLLFVSLFDSAAVAVVVAVTAVVVVVVTAVVCKMVWNDW